MKFSEKKTQVLLALYERKFDNNYYDISVLLDKWGISVSLNEAIQIGEALENEGLINLATTKDGASAFITGEGVEFVEEYDFFHSERQSPNFTQEDIAILNPKLDEMLERLGKLELGQQITYDDLKNEIDELRQLTKVLNKKNWFHLLQGKLVSIGLGKLTDKVFDIIRGTFGDSQLLE